MINDFSLLITKASNAKHIENFCKTNDINGMLFYGKGSAKKSLWEFLGLTDNSKIILMYNKDVEIEQIENLKKNCKDIFISKIGGNMTKERLFVCIINSGYADEVMDIARNCGATGGTILDGRGTGKTVDKILGTEVDSAKEVVLIFCDEQTAKNLEEKINEYINTKEYVSGICFTLNAKLFKELNVDNK